MEHLYYEHRYIENVHSVEEGISQDFPYVIVLDCIQSCYENVSGAFGRTWVILFDVDRNFSLDMLSLGSMMVALLRFVVDSTHGWECGGSSVFFETRI